MIEQLKYDLQSLKNKMAAEEQVGGGDPMTLQYLQGQIDMLESVIEMLED